MDLPKRKNIRKYGYNYNDDGSYFITICTKYREHYFGEIQDHKMILNDLGKYVWSCRNNIPSHFPFVEIGEFICMPDHIHGILIINNNQTNRRNANTARPNNRRDETFFVRSNISKRTDDNPSLQGATSGSLGSIVRGFKIGVTKFAHQNSIPFARQSRFYDHIISDEIEYFFIEQYIKNNPNNRGKKTNK